MNCLTIQEINQAEVNATIQQIDANIMKEQKLNIIVDRSNVLIFSSNFFILFQSDVFTTFLMYKTKPYSNKASKMGN